jgi:hypothetical protein
VNGQRLHAPTWIGIVVVVALIVTHAALFGFAFRGHLFMALIASMLGLAALKFIWWKLRR